MTAPQTARPASPRSTPTMLPSSASGKRRKTSSIFNLERNPSNNIEIPTSGTKTGGGQDESRVIATETPTGGDKVIGSGGTPIQSDDEDYGATDGFTGSGYNETGSTQ